MFEAHHILSDFVNKNLGRVSRRNGITISLPKELHKKTLSFGKHNFDPNRPAFNYLFDEVMILREILESSGFRNPNINKILSEIFRQNHLIGGL